MGRRRSPKPICGCWGASSSLPFRVAGLPGVFAGTCFSANEKVIQPPFIPCSQNPRGGEGGKGRGGGGGRPVVSPRGEGGVLLRGLATFGGRAGGWVRARGEGHVTGSDGLWVGPLGGGGGGLGGRGTGCGWGEIGGEGRGFGGQRVTIQGGGGRCGLINVFVGIGPNNAFEPYILFPYRLLLLSLGQIVLRFPA
jgi:hypothetical protein